MTVVPVRSYWLVTIAAVVSLFGTAAAFAAAPLVSATLEPRQISLGESAQLTITSAGNGMEAVSLPTVAGLEFRVVGQSRRVEIINGATLSTNSVIVRVVPQVAGIFTIPGITAQPLLLRVNPENGSGNSNPYGTSNPNRRPPISSGGSDGSMRLSADGAAFVRMNLPKRDVYVGESIPVDIEVGMRAGMVSSLNGLPTLTGSDFTLNNLSRKPERVEKLIDGQPFTLLTWHSVLAPVKPGTFNLSVETPITVRVRTRPASDSRIDDLLGDPFLQNFFGATVPKDITVASPPADLKVLALPTEGRPHDFSGAVGTFKISSDISAPTAAVGDPLTLRLHVTGAGNFDRVDSPMLERVEQWKSYPPKSSFTASDAVGAKGEKTFEQPLIASQPGAQTLPPLTFTYFDPSTRRYEVAHANPINVTISPSLADSAGSAPALTAGNTAGSPKGSTELLKPDHATGGRRIGSVVPLYFRPPFLALPSLLALLVAGGWFRLRRNTGDAGRDRIRDRRRAKEINRMLQQMNQAAASRDGAGFFSHARTALQNDLGARWRVAPEQIATADIETRLGAEGEDLRQIFVLADEANYAGGQMTATDFDRWTQVVRRQLAAESGS
jgi:hypothetical protein